METPVNQVAEPGSRQLDRALVSGVAWVASARWISQVLRWAATVVIAKLLLPSDYGIVGLSMILVGLVQQVAEFGLGAAVVQHRDLSRHTEERLAGVAAVSGTLMFLLSSVSAPLVARFFNEPALMMVVPVLSARFVLDAFATVPRGILTRELRFRELALLEAFESSVMAIVGLAGAFVWRSYWALVAANVVSGVALLVAVNLRAPIRPRSPGNLRELMSLLRFGRDLVVSRILWYWYTTCGLTVVGRLLSKDLAGAYSLAWSIAGMPAEKLASMIMSVVPGIFSSAKLIPGEMRRLYLGVLQAIAIVTFPLSVGLAVVAEPLVMNILGPQWVNAVVPLQLMSLFFVFRVVAALDPVVLLARHETHIDRNFTALFAIVMPLAFLVGVRWGLVGVAAAWFLQPVISLPLQARYVWSKIDVSVGTWMRALWPALSSTALMAAACLLLAYLKPVQQPLVLMTLQVVVGGMVYAAALWFGHPSAVKAALRFVARRRKPAGAAEARVAEELA